eukprot:3519750-Rhodomonas_salina.1
MDHAWERVKWTRYGSCLEKSEVELYINSSASSRTPGRSATEHINPLNHVSQAALNIHLRVEEKSPGPFESRAQPHSQHALRTEDAAALAAALRTAAPSTRTAPSEPWTAINQAQTSAERGVLLQTVGQRHQIRSDRALSRRCCCRSCKPSDFKVNPQAVHCGVLTPSGTAAGFKFAGAKLSLEENVDAGAVAVLQHLPHLQCCKVQGVDDAADGVPELPPKHTQSDTEVGISSELYLLRCGGVLNRRHCASVGVNVLHVVGIGVG